MAQSRLEKIGTIYTRVTGLLKSGAMKLEDRPLWYDVYEAFPPKEEPRFDRPAPKIHLKTIFYEEDKIRAIFHRSNKNIGTINMFDTRYKTLTQKFIEAYKKIEAQYEGAADEKQIYQEAIEMLKRDQEIKKVEDVSLSSAFKEVQEKVTLKINRDTSASEIFIAPETSHTSVSLTVPSACTSPSFHLSAKKSDSEASSDIFNWSQMQALYVQHEELTTDHLNPITLKGAAAVFEILKNQMGEICGDLHVGVAKMPQAIYDTFGALAHVKPTQSTVSSSSATIQTVRKMIVHFVSVMFVHDMILEFLRLREVDTALDLIKQVAVSHALVGVTPLEFRMLDWFIIHYLIKNKLITDENIISITSYLNTVSNYIEKFYMTQSVSHVKGRPKKKNHRTSKARENFRLMKKWKTLMKKFTQHEQLVDVLLAEQMHLRKTEDDIQSIDTLTLKRQDFIMKHFVREKELDVIDIEGPLGNPNEQSITSSITVDTQATIQSTQKSLSTTKGNSKVSHKNFFM